MPKLIPWLEEEFEESSYKRMLPMARILFNEGFEEAEDLFDVDIEDIITDISGLNASKKGKIRRIWRTVHDRMGVSGTMGLGSCSSLPPLH